MSTRTSTLLRTNHRRWCPCSAARQRPSTATVSLQSTDRPRCLSANKRGAEGSGGLARILTDEQRALFAEVHRLSCVTRSLARRVGNVAVKEDSLLEDIARLKRNNQRQALRERHQRQTQTQRPSSTQQPEQEAHASDTDALPPSLFTVVFCGEFNAGKTTLINALLGKELLDTGVLPTTDAITIVMADDKNEDDSDGAASEGEDAVVSATAGESAPTQLHLLAASAFPLLSDLCLIDTPGTNAVRSLQHTPSTLRILHDADLIVFVTSADRPFSESEQELLRTSIKAYRKRVVLVINKMDVLERQQGEDRGEATKKRVEDYVVEHAGDLLGARPMVIPLSARDALSVKLLYGSRGTPDGHVSDDLVDRQPSLWERSNFAALEHFLSKTLTASLRVKTKLLNPIGVAEGTLIECQHEIRQRRSELEVDVMTLKLLTSQTEAWVKEQREVIERCQSSVRHAIRGQSEMPRKVLEELSAFDQWKMGIGLGGGLFGHVWENASRRRQSARAASKAHGTDPHRHALENDLLCIAGECADMLSSRAQNQGTASIQYLGKRPAIMGSRGKVVGNVRVPKFQHLGNLRSSLAVAIRDATANLPNDSQCKEELYASLCRTALLSSLLLAGGVVPAGLCLSDVLDATAAMLASGTIASIGGATLPLGNRQMCRSLEKKWTGGSAHLEDTVKALFDDALHQIRSDLSESVAPYSRYVRAEGDLLKGLEDSTEEGIARAHRLRNKINKV